MGKNSISQIQKGSLGSNPFITALILSGNSITYLSIDCFRGIHFINELHLQRNNLQQIEKGAFRNMSIPKLLLFNNNLADIAGLLQGMKRKPRLLLLFGNPHITIMRSSDSQVHTSCHSFQTFSSPFAIKAKLICSPSK